jgi:hypothetical protein
MPPFQTEAEILAVVDGFENCTTEKGAFKHSDHLTVAVVFLQDLTIPQAIDRMRKALHRFIAHHQIDMQKYNETMTVFWIEVVADTLSKLEDATLVGKCNAIAESLTNSALALEYYSNDLLFSEAAREAFVKPDLKEWNRPG